MTPGRKRLAKAGGVIGAIAAALALGLVLDCIPYGYVTPMAPAQEADPSAIELPPGFRFSAFATEVPGARSMALAPDGTVFVGSRGARAIYAIPDRNRDGRGDRVIVVARGLDTPNGVAFRDGALYVAQLSKVTRYDGILGRLESPPAPVVVRDGFPRDRMHGWKYLAFGPDGKLYVPVGAPCNVCAIRDPYASITRMNADGSDFEIYARGVRNTVGFDWHPETRALWFTDNGRDWLGDDMPPDELNTAPRAGMHFGYPHCHGRALVDDELGRPEGCGGFTPPQRELGAHVAALGMKFYTGTRFPARYRGGIFIAEHGSWNRTTPTGYRVSFVPMRDGRPAGYEVFATGFQSGARAWGRPVDILQLSDGSLLVSDDHANAIWRISYAGS